MGAIEDKLRKQIKSEQSLKSRWKARAERYKRELARAISEIEVLTARLQGRKPRTAKETAKKSPLRLETPHDLREALIETLNDLRLTKAISFDAGESAQQRAAILEKEAKLILDILKLTKPEEPPAAPVVVCPDRMDEWDEFCKLHNVRMHNKEPIPTRCPNCNGAGVLRKAS